METVPYRRYLPGRVCQNRLPFSPPTKVAQPRKLPKTLANPRAAAMHHQGRDAAPAPTDNTADQHSLMALPGWLTIAWPRVDGGGGGASDTHFGGVPGPADHLEATPNSLAHAAPLDATSAPGPCNSPWSRPQVPIEWTEALDWVLSDSEGGDSPGGSGVVGEEEQQDEAGGARNTASNFVCAEGLHKGRDSRGTAAQETAAGPHGPHPTPLPAMGYCSQAGRGLVSLQAPGAVRQPSPVAVVSSPFLKVSCTVIPTAATTSTSGSPTPAHQPQPPQPRQPQPLSPPLSQPLSMHDGAAGSARVLRGGAVPALETSSSSSAGGVPQAWAGLGVVSSAPPPAWAPWVPSSTAPAPTTTTAIPTASFDVAPAQARVRRSRMPTQARPAGGSGGGSCGVVFLVPSAPNVNFNLKSGGDDGPSPVLLLPTDCNDANLGPGIPPPASQLRSSAAPRTTVPVVTCAGCVGAL